MSDVRYKVTMIIERVQEADDDAEECEPEEAVDAADVTFEQYGFSVLSSEIEPVVAPAPGVCPECGGSGFIGEPWCYPCKCVTSTGEPR